MKRAVGLVLVGLMLTGCATFLPSATQLKALSESERSWCVSVIVPGMGSGLVMGTGLPNGVVRCKGDQMEVTAKEGAAAPAPAPVPPAPVPAQPAPARGPMFK